MDEGRALPWFNEIEDVRQSNEMGQAEAEDWDMGMKKLLEELEGDQAVNEQSVGDEHDMGLGWALEGFGTEVMV